MYTLIFGLLITSIFTACSPRTAPASTETSANANTTTIDRDLKWNPADTVWTEKVYKSDDEWQKILTDDEFEITRRQGTERAFSSALYEVEDKGIYYCTCCANPLFTSETKFHSGTGWPSYWKPYSTKSVAVALDNSHGMTRDEVTCARCDAHLGHVFDDGPKPTGLRYCMDGVALHFEKSKK
ncbi:MAG: peptide-methionine (R)-S-oxide reductase MsrB [Bacteroidetes bacterium]|nr:peptide-methionine (R)-S-oxide reductase MsrB [Bacteroidota bacterium]